MYMTHYTVYHVILHCHMVYITASVPTARLRSTAWTQSVKPWLRTNCYQTRAPDNQFRQMQN